VDFVKYQEIVPALTEQGVVEVADEANLIRLEMDPDRPFTIRHIRDPESQVQPYPDAAVDERPKSELPEIIEHVLGKLHLNEVLVIPVGVWREVIDCVAFDMAEKEEWGEIDAIAAMHQNTRNALAIPRGETRVLIDMLRALFNHADGPKHDLIITSDVKPLLLEVFYDGAISVTCEAGVGDEIAQVIAER